MSEQLSNYNHPSFAVLILGLGLLHLVRGLTQGEDRLFFIWPLSFVLTGSLLLLFAQLSLQAAYWQALAFFALGFAPGFFICQLIVSEFDHFKKARKGLSVRVALFSGAIFFTLAHKTDLFWVELFYLAFIIIYLLMVMFARRPNLPVWDYVKTRSGLFSIAMVWFLVSALVFAGYQEHLALLFYGLSLIILLRFSHFIKDREGEEYDS